MTAFHNTPTSLIYNPSSAPGHQAPNGASTNVPPQINIPKEKANSSTVKYIITEFVTQFWNRYWIARVSSSMAASMLRGVTQLGTRLHALRYAALLVCGGQTGRQRRPPRPDSAHEERRVQCQDGKTPQQPHISHVTSQPGSARLGLACAQMGYSRTLPADGGGGAFQPPPPWYLPYTPASDSH